MTTSLILPLSSPFAQHLAANGRPDAVETLKIDSNAFHSSDASRNAPPPPPPPSGLFCASCTSELVRPLLDECAARARGSHPHTRPAAHAHDVGAAASTAAVLVVIFAWSWASVATVRACSNMLALFVLQITLAFVAVPMVLATVWRALVHWRQAMAWRAWCACAYFVSGQRADGSDSLASECAQLDGSVRAALRRVADLELAARGYRLTASWAIVARLDHVAASFRCARLRTCLLASLQRHVQCLSALARASCESEASDECSVDDRDWRFPARVFRFGSNSDGTGGDSVATLAELRAVARSAVATRLAAVQAAFCANQTSASCKSSSSASLPLAASTTASWLQDADDEFDDDGERPSARSDTNQPASSLSAPASRWLHWPHVFTSQLTALAAESNRAHSCALRARCTLAALQRCCAHASADACALDVLLCEGGGDENDMLSETVASVSSSSVDAHRELREISRAFSARIALLDQAPTVRNDVYPSTSSSNSSAHTATLLRTLVADLDAARAHIDELSRALGCDANAATAAAAIVQRASTCADDEADFEADGEHSSTGAGLLAAVMRSTPAVFQRDATARATSSSPSSSSSDDESDDDYRDRPLQRGAGGASVFRNTMSMFSELDSVLRHRAVAVAAPPTTLEAASESGSDSDSD